MTKNIYKEAYRTIVKIASILILFGILIAVLSHTHADHIDAYKTKFSTMGILIGMVTCSLSMPKVRRRYLEKSIGIHWDWAFQNRGVVFSKKW